MVWPGSERCRTEGTRDPRWALVRKDDVSADDAADGTMPLKGRCRGTMLHGGACDGSTREPIVPGAFVGALSGGALPLKVGRFQVIVRTSLLLCMSTTALVTTRLLSRPTTLPLTTSDTAA